jgi:hypothetical protein
VIDACIDQMHAIVATGTVGIGLMLDQTARTWDAGSAVIDALTKPPDSTRDE